MSFLTSRADPTHLCQTDLALEPFDWFRFNDEASVHRVHHQFTAFLRGLTGPARFVTWHAPTTLGPLIAWTIDSARQATDPWRKARLMQYRTYYEQIQRDSQFQRARSAMSLWTPASQDSATLGSFIQSYLNTSVSSEPWPALLTGEYRITAQPFWHLRPVGRPLGRPVLCLLGSYAFRQVDWSFFHPLIDLFLMGIPLALAVDIPKTWDTPEAIATLEGVITAIQTMGIGNSSIDTNGQRQINDALATVNDLQSGQNLHDVQIKLAIAAQDLPTLKKHVERVKNQLKPYLGLRHEVGVAQANTVKYFAPIPTHKIEGNPTTWPMSSAMAALPLGFLGVRKLQPRPGIIRGINQTGGWPYIYDDWDIRGGKKATHEVWVGTTGAGKTFALNCFLSRTLAHYGIPFDLLEPLGHGRALAANFNIEAYTLSARKTCLNPLDVVYTRIEQQLPHALMLFETFLNRPLSGTQLANHQRSFLSQALHQIYNRFDMPSLLPDRTPLVEDVCEELAKLGSTDDLKAVARELAQEIAGLATGPGPYGHFLNGRTSIDFSVSHETQPRIFCFHEMEDDPVLVSIAYTQVLATLMRTAMANENPRVIAVDEVYRMMRHPNLLQFLILATKILRTKRKKVIVIDQQLRVFLENPAARLLFENCPIRVIFQQRGGEDILVSDPAFTHYTPRHRDIIRSLPPTFFMMETPEGLFHIQSNASPDELKMFGKS